MRRWLTDTIHHAHKAQTTRHISFHSIFFFGHEPTTQKATYDIYKIPKINPHFLFPMDTIIMSKEIQT